MSIPQAHLVALCSDLGISATRGAAMLSLLLGVGFLCRQMWGAISDRIGALLTLLAGSLLQTAAITGFVLTQDEAGLFAVSGAFGVGFSALIPSLCTCDLRNTSPPMKRAGACRAYCC